MRKRQKGKRRKGKRRMKEKEEQKEEEKGRKEGTKRENHYRLRDSHASVLGKPLCSQLTANDERKRFLGSSLQYPSSLSCTLCTYLVSAAHLKPRERFPAHKELPRTAAPAVRAPDGHGAMLPKAVKFKGPELVLRPHCPGPGELVKSARQVYFAFLFDLLFK